MKKALYALMTILAASVLITGCGIPGSITITDGDQSVTITQGTNDTVTVDYTDGTNDTVSVEIDTKGLDTYNIDLEPTDLAKHYQNDDITRVGLSFGASTGYAGSCPGADLDAHRDDYILNAVGFNRCVKLVDDDFTKANALAKAKETCTGLKADDLVWINFSSHGGQAPDTTGIEADGKIEYVCAADQPITDKTIYDCLCWLPAVRVVMKVDTCHSGTMWRAPYDYGIGLKRYIRENNLPELKCSIVYIGGCADDKVSWGGPDGGELSLCAISQIPDAVDWIDYIDGIEDDMPKNQRPVITLVGDCSWVYDTPLFK